MFPIRNKTTSTKPMQTPLPGTGSDAVTTGHSAPILGCNNISCIQPPVIKISTQTKYTHGQIKQQMINLRIILNHLFKDTTNFDIEQNNPRPHFFDVLDYVTRRPEKIGISQKMKDF